MKQSKKIFVILGLIMILSLSIAACGGSSADDDSADVVAESNDSSSEDNSSSSEADAKSGADIYNGLCVACHGADATGVEGLGKNLIESEFVASMTDAELVAFIAEGRPASHEDNTTGVDMPPRGGNPALTDDDLLSVVAYVRELIGK